MRKFKVFTASVLTYLMLLSLVPSSFIEMVAKASENEYVAFVKSGYYLKGEAQYGEEVLVAYGEEQKGDTDIILVKNGKETLLKQVPGYDVVQVFENGTNKVGISYDKYGEEGLIRTFEEFDFTTRSFKEITKDEFDKLKPTYENNYEMEIMDLSNRDVANKFLKVINDKYDLNLNIDDKEYLEDMGAWGNTELDEYVYIRIDSAHDNVYSFTYREMSFCDDSKNIEYTGLLYNDNVYLIETTGMYYNISYNIVDNNSIYIWETINEDEDEYRLIKLQDGKEISNAEIKLGELSYFWRFKEVNDNIYIYDSKKLYIYELSGEVYKNINTIDIVCNIYNSSEKAMLEKSDGKIYLIVLNDDGILRIKDLTEEINSIYSEENYYINIESNNDIFSIVTSSGFILVQKKVEETPGVPNTPDDDEDLNQDDTNKPSQDNKLDIEIPTLKPNEVTEVELSSENATNFNLIIKDIETIKDGEGALKAILNNVTLNLPFSVIDKDLIGENDTVSVKLDVLSDSEITKGLKSVNKVFDFNLVVNKEGESVNIHNFKDGVAEITFALSDAELEGLNKDKLIVYYYNEETGKFEAMETKVEGNNITFKTSHFSKYVIAEEIVDSTVDKPEADKDESVVTPDNDDEVIIKPDTDNKPNTDSKPNNNSNNTTNNEEDKTESGKGELPTTGSVVSNNTILVLALGAVLVGGVMFTRKKKVA